MKFATIAVMAVAMVTQVEAETVCLIDMEGIEGKFRLWQHQSRRSTTMAPIKVSGNFSGLPEQDMDGFSLQMFGDNMCMGKEGEAMDDPVGTRVHDLFRMEGWTGIRSSFEGMSLDDMVGASLQLINGDRPIACCEITV